MVHLGRDVTSVEMICPAWLMSLAAFMSVVIVAVCANVRCNNNNNFNNNN